jgi:hypothetical protein
MVCYMTCSLAVVFLVANLYMTFTADQVDAKRKLYAALTPQELKEYEHIIVARRRIYLEGYLVGLILSFMILVMNVWQRVPLGRLSIACTVGAVTLITNYFYYMLSPKPDLLVVHLAEPRKRELWQQVYRRMQVKYHVGLLLGIVAAMLFAGGSSA